MRQEIFFEGNNFKLKEMYYKEKVALSVWEHRQNLPQDVYE